MMMDENDKKFAKLLGEGQMGNLDLFMRTSKYKPNMKSLAVALRAALERADAKAAERALDWSVDDAEGKQLHQQLYSEPEHYAQSGWRYGGSSAWLGLMASGKGPGDKGFDACADLLASQEIGLNGYFEVGKADSERLAHHLCARGWTRIAPRLERVANHRFDASQGSSDSLALALRSGHGSAALWALSRGCSGGPKSVVQGAKGVFDPSRPSSGGCDEPDGQERALALRVGAKISGLAAIDAEAWPRTMADPLSSPERLLCWLMIRSAWAQSDALGPEARQAGMAEAMAAEQGSDWKQIVGSADAPPKKGLLAFFSKAVSSAADAQAKLIAEAQALAQSREGISSGVLRQALPLVDKGDFERARKALEDAQPEARLLACVELLGLAKTGYWDMPMPREDSFDPNERHPMRWAGFKLALRACGQGVCGPIPGLSGTTLAGLCATLGFEDAISELIEAGASLDPDELAQGPSPLWLALRHGRARFAQVLLEAGASAVEGVKASPFGFPTRDWSIHLAFDMRQDKLVEDMLNADPRSAQLPDREGRTLLDRAFALEKDGADEAAKAFGAKMVAVAERAIVGREAHAPGARRAKAL